MPRWPERPQPDAILPGIDSIADEALLAMSEGAFSAMTADGGGPVPKRFHDELIDTLHALARAAYLAGMRDNVDQLYTPQQVAAMLGLSIHTLRVRSLQRDAGVIYGRGRMYTLEDVHTLQKTYAWGEVNGAKQRAEEARAARNVPQPADEWEKYWHECRMHALEYKAKLRERKERQMLANRLRLEAAAMAVEQTL